MRYTHRARGRTYAFSSLVEVLGRASPLRSGDVLAGSAAESGAERAAAQWVLADVPLTTFLEEPVVPYEDDEVTRLILDGHDALAFAPLRHLTVGGLREWLLATAAGPGAAAALAAAAPGLTPEMGAAVSKLMRNQELIAVGAATEVVTGFRSTIGLAGRLATRLQPNHPTDDPAGVAAAVLDGLLLGCGDAVIGINPASDNPETVARLLRLLDEVRRRYEIPTQSCVLTHVTTTIDLIAAGEPVDLVFQSIAGTQAANAGFGVDLAVLAEGRDAALSLGRGEVGEQVMYFETGQGSALSAGAHHGTGGLPVDQQTLEARAYAVARAFDPFLVNTVVGFIGPEYLYDGKQIIRAGLEDHFCGKLLGVPMGVDVCYTNHAEADSDDTDTLLTLLTAAGCSFIIAVPGSDDVMLGYQSTSFHDALYARRISGKRPAPEFEAWLDRVGLLADDGGIRPVDPALSVLRELV
ncbi:ethanolamine ammonia-lyase subunit EutB [Nocardioides carbamazepini]|uniref:ethanolamine ammonia-lyase subunit EutB n=1 Tax=Nocardioides carbamazepini TaxID=2854259 RepID=UPI00214A15F0|nr:ethanolamine ammonia-lyase subunit EutB [Nocardioides carbamazepini]MCR1786103.1 ethanolamine ammonia-lyase subunit EutB [Nocardioides carbamazepini]